MTYPLRLERTPSRRLWGGRRLEPLLGLEAPGEGDPWGESWQVYAGNRILNGPLAGLTLQAAADGLGADLLGTRALELYGTQVPLLAKFIDAAQDLSLQVHPDDDYARRFEAASGHLGKAEAWLILEADPDAFVYWGFREDVNEAQVRAAIADLSLAGLLNRVRVSAGDVVYNPPGTVHAIGAGILLFEIQQSSDLTYRLYDFGRRDSAGNLRELHVDKALQVANLQGGETALARPRQLLPGMRELVRCEHFVMQELLVQSEPLQQATSPGSFEIVTGVRGSTRLSLPAGAEYSLATGESLVLPATLGAWTLLGAGRVVRCFLPG